MLPDGVDKCLSECGLAGWGHDAKVSVYGPDGNGLAHTQGQHTEEGDFVGSSHKGGRNGQLFVSPGQQLGENIADVDRLGEF